MLVQFQCSPASPDHIHQVERKAVGHDWSVICGVGSLRLIIIIIMYIYHVLINALSAHMIHINLNMIFYTHVKHSPTKTIYIKYYLKQKPQTSSMDLCIYVDMGP